jgi:hypothetical protein
MHLHRVCVAFAEGWVVWLKAKGWLRLIDVWVGGGGVLKVLIHFFTRCSCCLVNVACVCARVVRVRVVCCR